MGFEGPSNPSCRQWGEVNWVLYVASGLWDVWCFVCALDGVASFFKSRASSAVSVFIRIFV